MVAPNATATQQLSVRNSTNGEKPVLMKIRLNYQVLQQLSVKFSFSAKKTPSQSEMARLLLDAHASRKLWTSAITQVEGMGPAPEHQGTLEFPK